MTIHSMEESIGITKWQMSKMIPKAILEHLNVHQTISDGHLGWMVCLILWKNSIKT